MAYPSSIPQAAVATPPLLQSALWHDLLGLLFAALALVVAYKLALPRPAPPVTLLPSTNCDLQREPCRLTLPGGGTIDLIVAGKPVVPNQPFVVEGHSDSSDVRLLELVIHGVEIDMSSAPQPFLSTGGTFQVEARLPLCTVNRMTWQMNVLLEADGRFLNWPLRFQTDTSG